jgi:hypothetical protein
VAARSEDQQGHRTSEPACRPGCSGPRHDHGAARRIVLGRAGRHAAIGGLCGCIPVGRQTGIRIAEQATARDDSVPGHPRQAAVGALRRSGARGRTENLGAARGRQARTPNPRRGPHLTRIPHLRRRASGLPWRRDVRLCSRRARENCQHPRDSQCPTDLHGVLPDRNDRPVRPALHILPVCHELCQQGGEA